MQIEYQQARGVSGKVPPTRNGKDEEEVGELIKTEKISMPRVMREREAHKQKKERT